MRPAHLLAAGLAGMFALAVGTAPAVRSTMYNSDILLPAAFFHQLFHGPGSVATFELPRVPSLFPDLLALLPLLAALPWRIAMLAYAAASFAALVLLGGTIAARWSGRPFGPATAMFGAMAACCILVDVLLDHAWGGFPPILFPVNHSGSLLCMLGGLLLVQRVAAGAGRGTGAAMALLAAVATASDRLFVVSFALPALAGTLAGAPAGLRMRRTAAVTLLAATGCVAGLALDRVLFATFLVRQPDVLPDLAASVGRLPALLRDPHTAIEAALAVLVVLAPSGWSRRCLRARFWWAASSTCVAVMMAALPLAYVDWASFRYVQPVWWWAPVALAAGLVRGAPRSLPQAAVATAGVAVAGLVPGPYGLLDLRTAARWRLPAEACLAALPPGTVHAGLAGYWTARALSASGDWRLPVAQLGPDGLPLIWGNDRRSFDADVSGTPPRFDFIVPDGLEPAPLLARFGPPDRQVPCASSTVWLYADPAWLPSRLALTRSGAGWRVDRPVSVPLPGLATLGGPLPASGIVPPLPSPGFATWGPYLPLAPGRWRVRLRYSLQTAPGSGNGAARWDAAAAPGGPVLATGTLPAGSDRTVEAEFDMPFEPPMIEVRTLAGPGDRLVLAGLRLCPAPAHSLAGPDEACAPGPEPP